MTPRSTPRVHPLRFLGGVCLMAVVGACSADESGPGGDATGGGPGVGTCGAGTTQCGVACVDLMTNPTHCGACDLTCAFGAACQAGSCTCPTGTTTCGGECADLAGNGDHCGACGVACASGQVCSGGTCVGLCPTPGQSVCGASCVDTTSDALNCGACGNPCGVGEVCSGSACVCQAGLADCGGTCVSLASDGAHCGSCDTACVGQVCAGGTCQAGCLAGQTACGASCVTLADDPLNCGACGVACAANEACVGGACGCQTGLTDCGGTCVDLEGNGEHCGACGAACAAGEVCAAGVCEGPCANPAQTVCGTSCVSLETDPANCGECGASCANGTCSDGACHCPSGWQLCAGTCRDVQSDVSNCGSCGAACGGGQACAAGTCQSGTGGAGTGGAGTGGVSTGGVSTGGVSTGGVSTGGVSTGGVSTGGTGGTGASTGRLVGGTCWPLCASASSDPDGDGWGWENSASCIVVGSTPYNQGTPCGGGGTGGSSTGGAATGGTGGSSDCGVSPVNPNATVQARKLLCYLYDVYGTSVLSGQQETSWDNPANDISWYVTNTGKYPAVLGGDYLYPNGTTSRALAYFNAGGITMIRYHMGAPPGSDTYENSLGSTNIQNVLTNGTTENTSFRSKLDYIATELQTLENANVAVLWAPFHEYQPGGWFWWSKGTASQFIELWRYMYDYLTTTKGLNNLVWLAPSSGSPSQQWYPGKAYLDIAGPDTYATDPPFSGMYNAARNIIGTTVPIPLHETGMVPQPSTMFPSAPWVLWNIWAGYQRDSHNTLSSIQSAYADSHTITRDEVPNLR